MRRRAAWGFCLACAAGAGFAADEAGEERFRELLYELRCLVCQNQSLADSDAELAGDLRQRVRSLMEQGLSDEQIVAHLQARYGDFIRYRPPLAPRTVALWAGPFVLLAVAAWLLLRRIRRTHARRAVAAELSAEERRRLGKILERESD